MKKVYQNGVEATLDVIGGKWKPMIICHLAVQPLRTGDLRRAIPGITQKVLTDQLRDLINDGIINRIVLVNTAPCKVEYQLTSYGTSLGDVLMQMSIWGEQRVANLNQDGQDIQLLNGHEGFSKIQGGSSVS
ncbi:winged helix-turn-helix transcriptional regulator [Levilactobacillus bambusae]|uniref:MarR family transcriptional regulator n=1 Tax=Levilactobacillus bambusae TaxID=2024736 RepID=A0A2V1N0F9_9LACO|nr:helix-turn-helix domain-containing protein [Levilactobacillus bambusae]PWG00552.1 MarR family transcriptional regulator [Levilactobacillus bambusae]